MKTIELGFKAKDKVTGFVGIATEKCEYLNGCIQYRISPPVDLKKPNEMPDSQWFDIEQLQYINDGVKAKKQPATKTSGGSTRNAPNNRDGKRP